MTIAELEAENRHLEGMLDYERNKCEHLLDSQRSCILQEVQQTIGLELEAIRDIINYIPEDDARRIRRRLDRIARYLEEV